MGGFKNHLEKLNNHSGHIFGMEETKDQGFDPFLNDEMVPEDDSQSFWDFFVFTPKLFHSHLFPLLLVEFV